MPFVTESLEVMKLGAIGGLGGAALAALSLILTPALAASSQKARKAKAPSFMSGGMTSFTPAVTDPRLAAAFARRGVQTGSFRFTPSSSASLDKSKAIRVAVRARSSKPSAVRAAAETSAAVAAVTPTAYNLGVAVGWKRFALSGDVARVQNDIVPGERKSAELGVAYVGKKAAGRVQVAAERSEGSQRLVGIDTSYQLDVGASYSIARNLDVTGGVRYKVQRDRLEALSDQRRDSQSVYIGTAFRF